MTHASASMLLLFLGGLVFGTAVSSGDGFTFVAAAILFVCAAWQSKTGKN